MVVISVKNKLASLRPPFAELYSPLTALLDVISKEASMATPVSPKAAKAYGDGYTKAKDLIKPVVDKLTTEQVNFLSGLQFTSPSDDQKNRVDILNSVISSWDSAAAKYMKGKIAEGDTAKKQFFDRLIEFDGAITSKGKPPLSPDK